MLIYLKNPVKNLADALVWPYLKYCAVLDARIHKGHKTIREQPNKGYKDREGCGGQDM